MIFFILFIIILLTYFLRFIIEINFKYLKNFRKIEIECGIFNIINKKINSLSYSLFLIIFLIFDLEISLIILQVIKIMNIIFRIIIIIILLSLFIELFEISIK